MNELMKHPLCLIALVCGVICYVQRCIENPMYIKVPIAIFFILLGAFVWLYLSLTFFLKIGWIK